MRLGRHGDETAAMEVQDQRVGGAHTLRFFIAFLSAAGPWRHNAGRRAHTHLTAQHGG